jgi:hypothetical protein
MVAAALCTPLAGHPAQRRWPPGQPLRAAAAAAVRAARRQAALRPGAAAGRRQRLPAAPAAGALSAEGVAAGDPELVFAPLRPDIDVKMGVASSTDKLDLTECELGRLPGQVRCGGGRGRAGGGPGMQPAPRPPAAQLRAARCPARPCGAAVRGAVRGAGG